MSIKLEWWQLIFLVVACIVSYFMGMHEKEQNMKIDNPEYFAWKNMNKTPQVDISAGLKEVKIKEKKR